MVLDSSWGQSYHVKLWLCECSSFRYMWKGQMVNLGVYVCGAIFAGTVSLASLPILNWLPSSSLFCEPGYNNKAQLHHLLPSPFSRSSVSFTFPSSVVSSHSSSLLNPSARFPLTFRTNSNFFFPFSSRCSFLHWPDPYNLSTFYSEMHQNSNLDLFSNNTCILRELIWSNGFKYHLYGVARPPPPISLKHEKSPCCLSDIGWMSHSHRYSIYLRQNS